MTYASSLQYSQRSLFSDLTAVLKSLNIFKNNNIISLIYLVSLLFLVFLTVSTQAKNPIVDYNSTSFSDAFLLDENKIIKLDNPDTIYVDVLSNYLSIEDDSEDLVPSDVMTTFLDNYNYHPNKFYNELDLLVSVNLKSYLSYWQNIRETTIKLINRFVIPPAFSSK